MLNAPNVFQSVDGDAKDIAFSHLNFSAVSTSDNAPKNTDGFDIGPASYVTLDDITTTNDDDCFAFKQGADYVTVTGITCTGSHGLSVGSLGKSSNDVVSNIYVSNATMINSAKAVGIKTYPGGSDYGTSTVTNVTYSGVVVQGSDYAIQIQGCYNGDSSYCDSNPGTSNFTDIVFENFSGTTSDQYSPATSNIDCSADGVCDLTISGYTVKDPSGGEEVLCANTPSDLGVTCTSGASG
jgi:galacturan 1,4-alpha-galacturonidase